MTPKLYGGRVCITAKRCFGGQLHMPYSSATHCASPVSLPIQCADLLLHNKEITMKTWFKPEISETEAGMEVTSYLPAELDRA